MSEQCAFNGCQNPGVILQGSRRVKGWFCPIHAKPCVIEPLKLERPSTGCRDVDRDIDQAVDIALLRIKPILRDLIREELKRVLNVEPDDSTQPPQIA